MSKGNTIKKCEWCIKEFVSWKFQQQRFCSNKCSGLWRTKDSRHKKKCKSCRKIFTTKKYRNKFYCSRECYLKERKKYSQTITCVICKKPFTSKNIDIKRGRKYCSKKCQGVSLSIKYKGKNNPAYIDGKSTLRKLERDNYRETIEYKSWRKGVFEKDNYTCRDCGRKRKKGDRVVLNAHHIKSWRRYPKSRYKLSNGKCLCVECHRKYKEK